MSSENSCPRTKERSHSLLHDPSCSAEVLVEPAATAAVTGFAQVLAAASAVAVAATAVAAVAATAVAAVAATAVAAVAATAAAPIAVVFASAAGLSILELSQKDLELLHFTSTSTHSARCSHAFP